jgi:hypothetical protein
MNKATKLKLAGALTAALSAAIAAWASGDWKAASAAFLGSLFSFGQGVLHPQPAAKDVQP